MEIKSTSEILKLFGPFSNTAFVVVAHKCESLLKILIHKIKNRIFISIKLKENPGSIKHINDRSLLKKYIYKWQILGICNLINFNILKTWTFINTLFYIYFAPFSINAFNRMQKYQCVLWIHLTEDKKIRIILS